MPVFLSLPMSVLQYQSISIAMPVSISQYRCASISMIVSISLHTGMSVSAFLRFIINQFRSRTGASTGVNQVRYRPARVNQIRYQSGPVSGASGIRRLFFPAPASCCVWTGALLAFVRLLLCRFLACRGPPVTFLRPVSGTGSARTL